MKKIVFIALLSVFAIGVGINSAKATAGDPPPCDYDHCPGGSDKCCSQGGVQLFINL